MLDLSDIHFPKRDVEKRQTPRHGMVFWMYVISCEGYSKIGIAADPIKRATNIASGNPFDVTIDGAFRVPIDLARLAEALCHAKLAAHHHRGEWFAVEPAVALALVEHVATKACEAFGQTTRRLKEINTTGNRVVVGAPRARQFKAAKVELRIHQPQIVLESDKQ